MCAPMTIYLSVSGFFSSRALCNALWLNRISLEKEEAAAAR